MSQKGNHTWDLEIEYYTCPKCEKIIENRESYHYRQGNYKKDVKCPFCKKDFTIVKQMNAGIVGGPQKPEMDWGSGDF